LFTNLVSFTRLYRDARSTKHKRRLYSVGFEPAIPAIQQPQTYTLGGRATGIGGNDS